MKKKNFKQKFLCYFAHPYESIGSPEEKLIMDELKSRGVTVVNPFDGEDELMLKKYGRTCYYPDPPYGLAREIWIKDLRQVKDCNMILVYVPDGVRLSGGCGIEMFYAYQQGKFIQIISKSKHPAFAYVLDGHTQMFTSIANWKRKRELRWD